jgi:hypothetical protein
MSVRDESPNLLDAVLGADSECIEELLREIALRIGGRHDKIQIVISCRQGAGPLIGIHDYDGGSSIHCKSTEKLLAAYAREGKGQ